MKVRIDFSVFTSNHEAIGNVDGELECVVEPMIGDTICLMLAPDNKPIPPGDHGGGLLTVTARMIRPNDPEAQLSLSLSDFVVDTKEQAIALMDYFESGYKLFANIYEDLADKGL
jgi:hypothetical protein